MRGGRGRARAPHSRPGHTLSYTYNRRRKSAAAAARPLPPFSLHNIPAPAAAAAAAAATARQWRRSQPPPKDALPSVNAARKRRSRKRREKGARGEERRLKTSKTLFPYFSVFVYLIPIMAIIDPSSAGSAWLQAQNQKTLRAAARRNGNGQLDCERDFQTAFSATETGWDGMGWGKRGIGGNEDARDRPEVHFGRSGGRDTATVQNCPLIWADHIG